MILPPPCFTVSSQHCFTPYNVQCMLLIKVNLKSFSQLLCHLWKDTTDSSVPCSVVHLVVNT